MKQYLFICMALCCSAVSAEGLRYGGAPLKKAYMQEAVAEFARAEKVTVALDGGSTSAAIKELSAGKLDLAGGGRFLTEEEKNQGMVETQVGWDALIPLAHMENSVDNLSLQQLQDIFTGKITNWAEIGGANLPVTVIAAPKNSGIRWEQERLVTNGTPFTDKAQDAALPTLAIAQVNNLTGAITIVSKADVVTQLKGRTKTLRLNNLKPTSKTLSDSSYPLVRPLVLATKGAPNGMIKKFIDFTLSDAGQRIMDRHCFAVKEVQGGTGE